MLNFQQIADVMENEMKKLDRLSKQIANVEDVDARLGIQIRKLTQLMLQDAKFAIIKHRSSTSQHNSGSSSSSRASPSAPSTPIRTMTPPPPSQPTPPKQPAKHFSPLAGNGLQVRYIKLNNIKILIRMPTQCQQCQPSKSGQHRTNCPMKIR